MQPALKSARPPAADTLDDRRRSTLGMPMLQGPRMAAQQHQTDRLNHSPRVAAQRQQWLGQFGQAVQLQGAPVVQRWPVRFVREGAGEIAVPMDDWTVVEFDKLTLGDLQRLVVAIEACKRQHTDGSTEAAELSRLALRASGWIKRRQPGAAGSVSSAQPASTVSASSEAATAELLAQATAAGQQAQDATHEAADQQRGRQWDPAVAAAPFELPHELQDTPGWCQQLARAAGAHAADPGFVAALRKLVVLAGLDPRIGLLLDRAVMGDGEPALVVRLFTHHQQVGGLGSYENGHLKLVSDGRDGPGRSSLQATILHELVHRLCFQLMKNRGQPYREHQVPEAMTPEVEGAATPIWLEWSCLGFQPLQEFLLARMGEQADKHALASATVAAIEAKANLLIRDYRSDSGELFNLEVLSHFAEVRLLLTELVATAHADSGLVDEFLQQFLPLTTPLFGHLLASARPSQPGLNSNNDP